MDVCGIQPVGHPFCWLQGQVANMGQTGGGMDELFLVRASTGEEPHHLAVNGCCVDTLTIGALSRFSQRRLGSACERPTSGWPATAQAVQRLWWIDVVFAALSGGRSIHSNCSTLLPSAMSAAPSVPLCQQS